MAVRQYIGARYVLKIYENSLNPLSADWESGTAYEPLTMVNYNNSSYISRKDVPPSVGNPVDNPSYWALSGLYNGQIAQLQTDLQALDDQVHAELETKRDLVSDRYYLFLGDSYDADHSISSRGWVDPLCEYAGISNYIKMTNGSYGFVGYISGYTWLSKVQTLTTAQREAITDVFIGGCAADWNNDPDDVAAAMANLNDWFKLNLPNLRNVTLAYLFFPYNSTISTLASCALLYEKVRNTAFSLGWFVSLGSEYIIADSRCRYNASDWVHPNATGVDHIAHYLVDALNGSCINVRENYSMSATIQTTNFSSSSTPNFNASITDGTFTLNSLTTYVLSITTAFSANSYVPFLETVFPIPVVKCAITIPAYYQVGTTITTCYAIIKFDDRTHANISIAGLNSSALAVGNQIVIPNFTFTTNLNAIGS